MAGVVNGDRVRIPPPDRSMVWLCVESVGFRHYPYRMAVLSSDSSSVDLSSVIRDGAVVNVVAFRTLYDRHSPELLAFLGARAKRAVSAEDVASDVWLKVISKADQFTGGNFRAWVFSIARTTLIDAVRKGQRENTTSGDVDVDVAVSEDNSATIAREEELNALKDCIQSVGGPFIEAVVRTKLNDVSPEVLAEELKVSRATIDSRVSRGKKLLSECLDGKQVAQQI